MILSAIRNQAHYAGQLAIVNYYSLDYTNVLDTAVSMALNRTVNAAAKPFDVVIANGFATFRAASLHFANKPCLAGLITQLDGQVGNCGIHPTYAGQALLAQSLLKAIRVSGRPARRIVVVRRIRPPRRSGLG
jgi:hypothetical protein